MKRNNEFKAKLRVAIQSAPIIYVPHYHYNYVDSVLYELFPDKEHFNKRICLGTVDELYEYGGENVGEVSFSTKRVRKELTELKLHSLLYDFMMYDRDERENEDANAGLSKNQKILLLKNVDLELQQDTQVQLLLQLFAEKYERGDYDSLSTIIIVSPTPVAQQPESLRNLFTVVDMSLPTTDDIMNLLHEETMGKDVLQSEGLLNELARNLQGLHLYEIRQILKSAKQYSGGVLTDKTSVHVLEEKKQILKKSGIIEVVEANESLESVGGLSRLTADIRKKAVIFRHLNEMFDNHIQIPKGILLMGMPGCGKSMIAKAIANEFNVSLLRLDVSRLMGKYVGESESNMRRALATAEAAHPCVLWIDEIEKAFAGARGGNNDDMLVKRMMGYFLTWMQERKTAVYIVATANDVMPPEFMRKGRFDEVYFVDFPNAEERISIFKKMMEKKKTKIVDFSEIDDNAIKDLCRKEMDDFSGAEMDALFNMVIENAFVEWIEQKKKNDENHQDTPAIKISKQKFDVAIASLSEHLMSKQKGQKIDDSLSSIEKIKKLNEIYKFQNA